jgi:16S rRNA (uracil1498-N3)-methyltransferase
MRRFFAEPGQFVDGIVSLSPVETRHLRDVLRLQPGAEVSVFDGDGNEFSAVVETVSKSGSILRVTKRSVPAAAESGLDLHLVAALLKGEKFDLVVQKAVELGVNRLTPLVTRRCDVKIKDPRSRLERWERVALEACKQSGRARLMKIDEAVDLAEFAKRPGEIAAAILFSERGGQKLDTVSVGKKMTAVVGPEGGWEDSELDAARSAGAQVVTLGGRILRAETAAIAITAILQHRFGDVN